MRLTFSNKAAVKIKSRMKKRVRIRKKVFGTEERPRLAVFRSTKHIYAQIVNDLTGQTLAEASTQSIDIKGSKSSREAAKQIGAEIAKRAKEKKISAVVFDRSGYLFHGRVQALADAAREAGLQF